MERIRRTCLELEEKVRIALVGKYVELPDAYISVVEALKHSGFAYNSDIEIDWIKAQELTRENVEERLKDADGILVPGGFGDRGVEGKSKRFVMLAKMTFRFRYLSWYADGLCRICT